MHDTNTRFPDLETQYSTWYICRLGQCLDEGAHQDSFNANMALTQLAQSAWKIIPQFQSRSITATVRFYTEELGFFLGGIYPDDVDASEATFCSVAMGRKADANIYFFLSKPEDFHPRAVHIALGTIQLDQYYQQLKSGGKVEMMADIEDTAWGYRQFTVKDNDGNRLTFFKFLEGGNPGTEP
jgi:uncharacterized glyoxalase superfamily protein PhnB